MLYNKEIAPPFVPVVHEASDVSHVDPEFLQEVPLETPVQDSQLAALAQSEGDFDNFTYVNEHNLSELQEQEFATTGRSSKRPQTELLNLKASFMNCDDDELQHAAAQQMGGGDSQQAGAAGST